MFETTHTPEERLARVEKLVEEMHGMMRAERRSRRIGSLFKLIYWSAFLYAWWWGYQHYLQPMLGQLSETLQQVQSAQKSLSDTTAKVNAGIGSATSSIDLSKIQEMIGNFLPKK